MPEFNVTAHSDRSPSGCFWCQSHGGPFVDLQLSDTPVYTEAGIRNFSGAVYLCFTCVRQIARATGDFADPKELAEAKAELQRMSLKLAQMELDVESAEAKASLTERKLLTRFERELQQPEPVLHVPEPSEARTGILGRRLKRTAVE